MAANFNAVYLGSVVHKRVRPLAHALSYKVFCVLIDCETLASSAQNLRFFSYNKFNLFSIYDRDHGDGDGVALTTYLNNISEQAGFSTIISRYLMLSYPRILGYGFNPITVYYGLDDHDRIRLMIYEVNNTFGQRRSYVVPVHEGRSDLISQKCTKQLYVSPFNSDKGQYSFAVTPLGNKMTVGVALRTAEGPLMKAYFRASRCDLTDGNLMQALLKTGWMTVKVTMGIHFEAMKLWLKGLPLMPRPEAPKTAVTIVDAASESQH